MKRSITNSLFLVFICTIAAISFYFIGKEVRQFSSPSDREKGMIYVSIGTFIFVFLSQFLFVFFRVRKRERSSVFSFLIGEVCTGLITGFLSFLLVIAFTYYNNRRWNSLHRKTLIDEYTESFNSLFILLILFMLFSLVIGLIVRAFQIRKPSAKSVDALDANLPE